jgi:hypothetical protein
LDDRDVACVARIQLALADVAAGWVDRYDSAEAMMAATDIVRTDNE